MEKVRKKRKSNVIGGCTTSKEKKIEKDALPMRNKKGM